MLDVRVKFATNPHHPTISMITQQLAIILGGQRTDQPTETEGVHYIVLAAKKDVKMKESPTISFRINTPRQTIIIDFHASDDLLERKGESGKISADSIERECQNEMSCGEMSQNYTTSS